MHVVGPLGIRDGLLESYSDVLTPAAIDALVALSPLNVDRRALMQARIDRRAKRLRDRERIAFLDSESTIGRTRIRVSDARAGRLRGQ